MFLLNNLKIVKLLVANHPKLVLPICVFVSNCPLNLAFNL